MPDVDAIVQKQDIPSQNPGKRIVKFQSYPWWTELQKEERDIAASILAEHASKPTKPWPAANGFDDAASYLTAIKALGEDAQTQVLQAIVSRAAADVILEDDSWDDALRGVWILKRVLASGGWPRSNWSARRAEFGQRLVFGLTKALWPTFRTKEVWLEIEGGLTDMDGWHLGGAFEQPGLNKWSQNRPHLRGLEPVCAIEGFAGPRVDRLDGRSFWQTTSILNADKWWGWHLATLLGWKHSGRVQLRLALLDEVEASPAFDNEAIARRDHVGFARGALHRQRIARGRRPRCGFAFTLR